MRHPARFLALLERKARRPMGAVELELLRHRLHRKELAAQARGAARRALLWKAYRLATQRRCQALATPPWRSSGPVRAAGAHEALVTLLAVLAALQRPGGRRAYHGADF
jgi:hypothetical protein